ncbi:SCO4848 family membrane protein [Demequina activiva]|uniref:Uncharacterized protein n=1 Tax=Demequina activiva TaxID=1582364 RepID=A0A919Q3E2_9MICO|nr:hypothetical protein [Demequina activiva]GIG53583.1 hypothetical protein Dac01nite_03350 [Demequina activiva]
MVLTLSIVLLINALFAIAVWPRFLKRIGADERSTDAAGSRTRFYRVHAVLITAALALAGVSLIAGIAGLASLA